MRYLELRAEGWRNLAPCRLEFHPAVNFIHGANGQGKTNLIEALLYLVSGRSHRRARDEELVNFDGEHYFLAGTLADDGGGTLRFGASCLRGGPKKLTLDGEEVARLADLIGLTGTVIFGPGDVELVTGEPELRRRFLDYTFAKTDPAYLRRLLELRRILRQRNALLRSGRGREHLRLWTERLAETGAALILARRRGLVDLGAAAARFYAQMGPAEEVLDLGYQTRIKGEDEQALTASLAAALEALENSEWLKKRTLAGPQRDDMVIDIGGRNARKFASQGQKRSAAVALKLAQAEYLARVRRDRPIVFLDDVFSELDGDRREKLCHLVGQNYQTFIAAPQVEDLRRELFAELRLFRVDAGRITAA
ncbi:MAG: DNA replication/repair protein RecF [Candidatus Latescibacteria bacterium]|nr:DNA replication/repair protein RecF [Candidatus Latescibacterota bacterium]